MDQLVDLMTRDYGTGVLPMPYILLGLLLALAGGLVLAWVYMFTHSGLSYSRSFVGSLSVIPMIVSLVMMVMVDSIITAFGLMAVFAIVRFRNILRDTLDTAFILCVIVIGMAAGTQKYTLAVVTVVASTSMMLFIWWTDFGVRHRYDYILNFRWSEPLNELSRATDVLYRHGRYVQCASQRLAAEKGTDLSYRLLLRDPSRGEDLVRELERTEGVSRVVSLKAEDEAEV